MKKPMLMIGILMVIVTVYQNKSKLPWGFLSNEKLKTNSCRAVIVPLEKKIPSHWKIFCEENNLAVEIKERPLETKQDLRTYLYRQLANHLSEIAKNSPNDSLDRVFMVRLKVMYPGLEINALTEGKYLSKLATMTSSQLIAEHLQATVQIKETVKAP